VLLNVEGLLTVLCCWIRFYESPTKAHKFHFFSGEPRSQFVLEGLIIGCLSMCGGAKPLLSTCLNPVLSVLCCRPAVCCSRDRLDCIFEAQPFNVHARGGDVRQCTCVSRCAGVHCVHIPAKDKVRGVIVGIRSMCLHLLLHRLRLIAGTVLQQPFLPNSGFYFKKWWGGRLYNVIHLQYT